jgi:fructose-bisphosphate aldolase class II
VLHGSSGVPEESIINGIRAGLTKINVSTRLNATFTVAIREYLTRNPELVDSRSYVAAGREAVLHEAARLLVLFASTTKLTG